MHDKTCGPAECRHKPLKEAAEEYGKCILERAACHDQRTGIQYVSNVSINVEIRGSVYGENIPIKSLSDTHEGLIAFRKKVDERDSKGNPIFRSCSKTPKKSFTELDTMCRETIGIPIQEIVHWGQDKWDEKKFHPANGVHKKSIIIAREEWDKCVCKHSACHIQSPKAHWRK